MSKLQKFTYRLMLILVLVFLVAPAVTAQDTTSTTDFSYTLHPARAIQSDLAKQLQALPEWEGVVEKLSNKIDEQYEHATPLPCFPKKQAEELLDKVRVETKRDDISSKDVIGFLLSEIELIQLDMDVQKAYELDDKSENGKYATLAFVLKFNPDELKCVLDLLKKGEQYEFLKNDDHGFLIVFRGLKKDLTLYMQSLKLPHYEGHAVVIGCDQERVGEKMDSLAQYKPDANAPMEVLKIGPGVIDVLKAEMQKKIDKGESVRDQKNFLKLLDEIKGVQFISGDFDGKSMTKAELSLANAESAENLRQVAQGGVAMLRILKNAEGVDEIGQQAIGFLSSIVFEAKETKLTAEINYSQPSFLKIAAIILNEVSKKID